MTDISVFKDIVYTIPFPLAVAHPLYENGELKDFELSYVNQAFNMITNTTLYIGDNFSDKVFTALGYLPFLEICRNVYLLNENSEFYCFSKAWDRWIKAVIFRIQENQLCLLFTDITEEKRKEHQLKEQNLRLSTMSEELAFSRQHLKHKLEKIEKLNSELEKLAYFDSLTSLPNKLNFMNALENAIELAKVDKGLIGLIFIDIDNMKNINDIQGHLSGDLFLEKVAQVLKSFENHSIRAFRYGGDEFLILVTDLESEASMITVADTVLEALSAVQASVSAGVAIYPNDTNSPNELLRYSDMAMHSVKKNGKNNVAFFHTLMQEKFLEQVNLEEKLYHALDENKFQLYFQPQVDIKTNSLRGFEALLRWLDEELGWISPERFIPLAEESRIIIPLGTWVLNRAFETLKKWQQEFSFEGIMSINVSPIQLKHPSFFEDFKKMISDYELEPSKIEIEITEGVLIDNIDQTIELLKKIKALGVGISLDDFGTGYSSLSYLQLLPLTTLKIDKSFIDNIATKASFEADITGAIISVVNKMGLETIAEGVENEEQLKILESINCRNTQGFLMGKPMPSELCSKMLSGDESAIIRNIDDQPPIRYSI